MRYVGKFTILLTFTMLLLQSVTSCKTYSWSGGYSVGCDGHFSWEPMHCTITLTSPDTFDWTATSTVDGVTFQPSSGSEAAGKSSGDIHVTFPADACPGPRGSFIGSLYFTDDAHDLMLIVNLARDGSGNCVFKN